MTASEELTLPRLFERQVLDRDGGCCVFCKDPAVAVLQIMDGRLFPDGGLHPDNAMAVCAPHRAECENSIISLEEARIATGIETTYLPPHLYPEERYDRWGNQILPNGRRLPGELFHEPSVQEALRAAGLIDLFSHHVKYPRTHHAPWSSAVQNDDKVIQNLSALEGERVVGTVKMDGESATLYQDYFHARSVDGRHHPSRDWIKNFWSSIRWDIPPRWRICGENLYARHSIAYEALPSYFMGFSVWNEANVALSWSETQEWFDLLGVVPVETVYDGPFDPAAMKRTASEVFARGDEGVVFRAAREIPYRDFSRLVIKDVRPGHVQTNKHWMHDEITTNGLSSATAKPPR